MRLLFLGDVMGRAGRNAVTDRLPNLIETYRLDFVVVNAENAAHGFGITEDICRAILDAGADVITSGNHAWDQREALVFIEREQRLLRPINYPKGTPGCGSGVFTARNGARVLVINAMGQVYMGNWDDPFALVECELDACRLGEHVDAVIIDMHAEANSEKQAMAHFVDGRASLVVGTHTHVPTADHQVLPGGTAIQSDAGMCGDYDSVLGMEKEEPLQRFTKKIPQSRFTPALGPATICGVGVDVDDSTGLARAVAPLRLGARLEETVPAFWLD